MKLYEALNRAFREGGTTATDAARSLGRLPRHGLGKLLATVGLDQGEGRRLPLDADVSEWHARALAEVVPTARNAHFRRIWSEPLV